MGLNMEAEESVNLTPPTEKLQTDGEMDGKMFGWMDGCI